MKRIGLISDTHGYFHPKLTKYFGECDEIWHAGDIGSLEVTDQLAEIAPVKAVYGNIDNHVIRAEFPKNLRFTCEGKDIWITHIGGKPYSYNQFTRPTMQTNPPDIFICGHSHILLVQYDKRVNCLCLNPGAAGKKGFHKVQTVLRFTLDQGNIRDMEAIELGKMPI